MIAKWAQKDVETLGNLLNNNNNNNNNNNSKRYTKVQILKPLFTLFFLTPSCSSVLCPGVFLSTHGLNDWGL